MILDFFHAIFDAINIPVGTGAITTQSNHMKVAAMVTSNNKQYKTIFIMLSLGILTSTSEDTYVRYLVSTEVDLLY